MPFAVRCRVLCGVCVVRCWFCAVCVVCCSLFDDDCVLFVARCLLGYFACCLLCDVFVTMYCVVFSLYFVGLRLLSVCCLLSD